MSDDALHSYFEKWLAAQPAQRLALPFIDAQTHPGHLALAALEHEWIDAAYGIREPQVAQVKLGWWAEELAGAAASGGRHPLTQALFASPRAGDIDLALWLAPIRAATAQLDAPTAADFQAQCEQAMALHGALARLETRWWFGEQADASRAEALAVADHLLVEVALLDQHHDRERLPLPMHGLARHGLDRPSLAADSDARRAAVNEQLQAIADLLDRARRQPGPLTLFRGLQMRENRRLLRQARRAAEPLGRLRALRARTAPGSVFRAWSAARDWRRSRAP